MGIGDGPAVVTTIEKERGRNPNRQTRRKNFSNNNHKLKSNSKSKQKRRSKKDSSDESSAVELSSSDDSEWNACRVSPSKICVRLTVKQSIT